MLTLAITCGIFFGLYCHFFVLVPITLLAGLACALGLLFDGQNTAAVFSVMLVPSVALQGGYMIGLTSRDFMWPRLRGRPGMKVTTEVQGSPRNNLGRRY
jgi:hypothetical protein